MKFEIICSGDEKGLAKIIEWYNSNYKTDFKLVGVVYDEVVFAEIEVSNYKESDIFDLGFQYGASVQQVR